MIIIENDKWKKEQDDLETNIGKWVYQRFFGPICHFSISKCDGTVYVTPFKVDVEPTNSVWDIQILVSMVDELLDLFEEVVIFIPVLKTRIKFTNRENIKEQICHVIETIPLI